MTSSSQLVSQRSQIFKIIVSGVQKSINKHLPPGIHRDFLLWALSSQNPHLEIYWKLIGVEQLTKMTLMLLEDLVEEDQFSKFDYYIEKMMGYQVFEIVSDNLAIGLASNSSQDTTKEIRKSALKDFNSYLIARLQSNYNPDQQIHPFELLSQKVSFFEQTLVADQWRMLAQAFVDYHQNCTLSDLEYSVFPHLLLNLETCIDLAESIPTHYVSSLLRQGLIDRYEGVNTLLESEFLTPSQLADVGTKTMLVMPTLVYFVEPVVNIPNPNPALAEVVEEGLLAQALYDAALLIRLVNDLGTKAITLSSSEKTILEKKILSYYQEQKISNESLTINEFFAKISSQFGLTRIYKDAVYGEFNICLDRCRKMNSIPEAVADFFKSLTFFAELYEQRHTRLVESLELISRRLNDDRPSTIIMRFVEFHEWLYSNDFETGKGEYCFSND